MGRRWVRALVWVGGVFLFSCSDAAPPPDGDGSGNCGNLEACGALCVDLQTNRAHCGACDQACGEAETCVEGICECAEGARRCEGSCVDTQADMRNCGSCGERCAEGQTCVDGGCVEACEKGAIVCDGVCVDHLRDDRNCGDCGHTCPEGKSCQAGECKPGAACPEGENLCNGTCIDTDTDAMHCGDCDTPCPPGAACVGGECVCPDSERICDGSCVDTESDLSHCGGCDLRCGDQENAVGGVCEEGSCELECTFGYDDCDGDAENGCEVELQSDVANCGRCGIDCRDAPFVEGARCTFGTCQILECAAGRGNCDFNPENGCESVLAEDPQNCGGCGFACSLLPNNRAAPACNDGVCALECEDGYGDCDEDVGTGCEADLGRDDDNCGGCGIQCGDTEQCQEGMCVDFEVAQWPVPPDGPTGFDLSIPGVAIDPVTGLHWQREPGFPVTRDKVESTCENLRLGGFDDWRGPTIVELMTILDYDRHYPAIDKSIFPFDEAHDFGFIWSTTFNESTSFAHSSPGWWSPFLFNGIIASSDGTNQLLLFCVRNATGHPGKHLVYEESDEVVRAEKTGLMWQRRHHDVPLSWSDAVSYCDGLSLGGHEDWRLPRVKELLTIVDRRRMQPASDPAFTGASSDAYWTSTPAKEDESQRWEVNFFVGTAFTSSTTKTNAVRCVRSL